MNNLICKIFGHKNDKNRLKSSLRFTGWKRVWNPEYVRHEVAHKCERCSETYIVGYINTDHQDRIWE